MTKYLSFLIVFDYIQMVPHVCELKVSYTNQVHTGNSCCKSHNNKQKLKHLCKLFSDFDLDSGVLCIQILLSYMFSIWNITNIGFNRHLPASIFKPLKAILSKSDIIVLLGHDHFQSKGEAKRSSDGQEPWLVQYSMTDKVSLKERKNNASVDGWLNENIIKSDEAFVSFVVVKLVTRCLTYKTCWKSVDEDHNENSCVVQNYFCGVIFAPSSTSGVTVLFQEIHRIVVYLLVTETVIYSYLF